MLLPKLRLAAALAASFLAATLSAQYWERDHSFAPTFEGPNPLFDSVVPVVASPGGKALVVPRYSVNGILAPSRPVRLNSDGSVDPTFNGPREGPWGVRAVYPDGRALVSRSKGTATGSITELFRLLSHGDFDPTFASIAVEGDLEVRILVDGRILIFGRFNRIGIFERRGFAALNADGSVSAAFSSTFSGATLTDSTASLVHSVLPLSDGRIVVAGSFANLGPEKLNRLARLNADDTIDGAFNANAAGVSSPRPLAENPDGSMLVRDGSANLLRLSASGARDPNFAPQFVGTPQLVGSALLNEKLYYTANSGRELRRLDRNGAADAAFLVSTVSDPTLTAALPAVGDDGALLIPAALTSARRASGFAISRVSADGRLDPNYAPRFGEFAVPTNFLRQPDGKTLVTGLFEYVSGIPTVSLRTFARLNADGSLDPTFAAALEANDEVSQLFLQPNGKIVARGAFTGASGLRRVIRFNADGTRDATFSFAPTHSPLLAIDPDGNLYATTGEAAPRIVRYTADGALDPSFQSTPNGQTGSIVALADGRVAILPTPSSSGPTPRITLLRRDGSADASFNLSGGLSPTAVLGAVALPDGGVAIVATERATSGPYLRAMRINRHGVIDYTYVGRETGSSIFRDYLNVGGVLYDLLRETSAPSGTVLHATFTDASLSVDTEGRLVERVSTSFSSFEAYRRTAAASPSVDPRPRIVVQAPGIAGSLPAGAPLSLTVFAGGLFPLSYEWKKDGVAIPDATASTYRVSRPQASDAGDYVLTVSNAYGSVSTTTMRVAFNTTALAGSYRGPVTAGGEAGEFALSLRRDGNGALLLRVGPASAIVVENFRTAADGVFSARGTVHGELEAARTGAVTVTGTLSSTGAVTGAIAELGLAFQGAKTSGTTPTDIYVARALDGRSGTLHAIAEADGRVFLVATSGGSAASATGVRRDNGAIELPPGSALAIDASLDVATGAIAASGAGGAFAGMRFGGLRHDVPRIDRLANISTRGQAGAGDAAMIAGFVIAGNAPRQMLIRGIGPGLAEFGVANRLADPRLELFRGPTRLTQSDDWGNEAAAETIVATAARVGGFPLLASRKDAALLVSLEPGDYTAQVTGANDTAGVALVEVYDAGAADSTPTAPRLVNIATRGRVGAGENALIAGIVVTGNAPKRLLVRGIGPALAPFGVGDTLADPVLTILAGATALVTNDDWHTPVHGASSAEIAAAAASVNAFALPAGSRDAAVLLTLAPGNYTAQIAGKADASGIALVEVYEVSN